MRPVPASSVNRRFGKYTLVAKLAQGGMAEIFLARLGGVGGFEKLVCIKRILPEYAADETFVGMFLDEAKIAARITHHNVCHVFELGELDGQLYIAMEYLEGVPVSVFRRKELYAPQPDPRLVVGIAVQACEGLHHAHQLKGSDGQLLGVVHRDVSPQNLFITADGVVKLLDFGIVKAQSRSAKTTTGAVKGTYAYMPPEQLKSEGVDRRSDIFALGTVIWELLGRRPLFKRDTDFKTFEAITKEPIPDVCVYRPDVPPALGEAIMKALSRSREDRYPTARAFGEALAASVASIGGPMQPSTLGDEVTRAFGDKIEEQHAMLEAARAGGEFDIEEPQSTNLGVLDVQTTPVSQLKRRSSMMRVPTAPPSAEMQAMRVPTAPPFAEMELGREIRHTPTPFPAQYPEYPARYSAQYPAASPPSRFGLVLLLLLLAAAGGAGAVYYFFVYKNVESSAKPDDVVSMPAAKSDDKVVMATPADASVAVTPPDPAVKPVDSPDAGVAETKIAAEVDTKVEAPTVPDEPAHPSHPARTIKQPVKQPVKQPKQPKQPVKQPVKPVKQPVDEPVDEPVEIKQSPPPAPPAASGPPGTITIDSTPMYSTIRIDGKDFGDTPLFNLKLPPGKHTVKAVSKAGGSRTLTITIEPGKKAAPLRIEW